MAGGRAIERSESSALGAPRATARRAHPQGLAGTVLALQRTAGNRAVCQLAAGRAQILRGRRKGPGGAGSTDQKRVKAAPNQAQVTFASLPQAAQNAIRDIVAGTEGPYLRPDKGRHNTDPETGLQKTGNLRVREYHVTPSNESMRIVTRKAENQEMTFYWDPSHVGGTYTYHRVTGVPPAPAPAPAPVPAPAPALAPVAPVVAAPPVAVAAPVAPAPVLVGAVDSWEDL